MNRHLRNIAAFALGVLISFLLMVPSAYAGKWPIAGPGSTSVSNNRFGSGPGNPTTTYTVSSSQVKDITSDATDITVSRRSPFTSRNRYGDIATGEIIDAIKLNKAGLALDLRGLMKGGLIGLGLTLMQDYAVQKGFEWMEDAKQYYKNSVPNPNGAIQGDPTTACNTAVYPTNRTVVYSLNPNGTQVTVFGPRDIYPNTPYTYNYATYWQTKYTLSRYCNDGGGLWTAVRINPTATSVPATDSDIANFIDDMLFNAPDRAIKDMIAKGIPTEYADPANKSIPIPVITVPREIEKTTTPNPDGTTTTKKKESTTETKVAPTGELTQTEKVVETTTIKDSAGNTTTSTTGPTTETKPEIMPDIADPSMPTVPSLYSQKYPNGLQGVWDAKKAALQNTAFVQSISLLAPANWNAGTCPSWTINFDIQANMAYGNQVFPFPCWLVPFLKAALLLTAAFTARKLIWG